MNTEPIALIDMDGTVTDFHNALEHDLQRVLGADRDKVSLETLENIERLIKSQPGWWRELEPIQLGLGIVQTLEDIGFKLMVLTKGPVYSKNAWTEKVEWCADHLPHADVTITHQKNLVYGKILIDDWPPYIERWLEWRPRGVVIMPAQSWNANFTHPNVFRVATSEDVFKLREQLVEVYNR